MSDVETGAVRAERRPRGRSRRGRSVSRRRLSPWRRFLLRDGLRCQRRADTGARVALSRYRSAPSRRSRHRRHERGQTVQPVAHAASALLAAEPRPRYRRRLSHWREHERHRRHRTPRLHGEPRGSHEQPRRNRRQHRLSVFRPRAAGHPARRIAGLAKPRRHLRAQPATRPARRALSPYVERRRARHLDSPTLPHVDHALRGRRGRTLGSLHDSRRADPEHRHDRPVRNARLPQSHCRREFRKLSTSAVQHLAGGRRFAEHHGPRPAHAAASPRREGRASARSDPPPSTSRSTFLDLRTMSSRCAAPAAGPTTTRTATSRSAA